MFRQLAVFAAFILLVGCAGKPSDQSGTVQAAGSLDRPAALGTLEPTLKAGTQIHVRLGESITTAHNNTGDKFTATLDSPISVNEKTAVPKGTPFHGHVTTAAESGRLKGRAVLGVTLDSFELNGKTYRIETSSASRASAGHKKRNAVLIGGGSGLGAAIGAVAGGGKGALIG